MQSRVDNFEKANDPKYRKAYEEVAAQLMKQLGHDDLDKLWKEFS